MEDESLGNTPANNTQMMLTEVPQKKKTEQQRQGSTFSSVFPNKITLNRIRIISFWVRIEENRQIISHFYK